MKTRAKKKEPQNEPKVSTGTNEGAQNFDVANCSDRPVPYGKCRGFRMILTPERDLGKWCVRGSKWCWTEERG